MEARNTHNPVGRYLPETYGEALFTSERPEYDVQTDIYVVDKGLAAASLYRKSWLRRCNQTRALSHHFVELFPDELACFGFPPPLHRDAHQISTGFGTLDHLRTRQNQQHDQRFLGTNHAFFTFHAPRRCEHDCSESVDADAWRSRDQLCCFTSKCLLHANVPAQPWRRRRWCSWLSWSAARCGVRIRLAPCRPTQCAWVFSCWLRCPRSTWSIHPVLPRRLLKSPPSLCCVEWV